MLDIVLPVYNGLHHVRACLRTIRAYTSSPYQLQVVDDGSRPYVARQVARLLEELWADHATSPQLLVNEVNRGYLHAVNRGIAAGSNPFVLLLNSDTLVTPGWDTGLIDCLQSAPDIGIACPLANHANFTRVELPSGLTFLQAAAAIRDLGSARYPDIGLASGFCFIARRALYEEIGAFDPLFGHGYYEESDLCMRALERGRRVVADDATFIYHHGWGSFGGDQRNRWMLRNRELFEERWGSAHDQYRRRILEAAPFQAQEAALREAASAPAQRAAGAGPTYRQRSPEAWTALARKVRSRRRPAKRSGRPLRVLYVLPGLGAYGGVLSVIQLVNRLLLAGVEAQVVTSGRVDEDIFREPMYFRPHLVGAVPDLARAVPPFDVVLATRWDTVYDALLLGDAWDAPVASFVQDLEPLTETEPDARAAAELSLRLVEHKIVKSRWLAGELRGFGGAVHRIPLGLNLDVFHPGPPAAHGPGLRVLSASRPGAGHRNLEGTVEIFRRLVDRRRDVVPTFFGQPFEVVGLDRVEHLGRLSQVEVADALRSTSVLLDASLFQGFGRPGLEAMACGVPAVLTTEGGINEYARDGSNCLQVDPRDVEGNVAAIERLIDEPALRERIVEEGLATVRAFDVEDEAQRTLGLLQELLGRS